MPMHSGGTEITMLYKNAELFNTEEIIENSDGSISWLRVPKKVYENLETDEQGKRMAKCSTGVEIRFVLKGDSAVIKMCCESGDGKFHIYRGGIQGGWEDHEVHKTVRDNVEEFEIENSEVIDKIDVMHKRLRLDWDSKVIRLIFDKGTYKIFDICGDIEPPEKEQCPKKTMLCYGSSITHGSNALDMSHSWASVLGHNLNVDVRNLGMAGSCWMEPDFVEFLAAEGEKGTWDMATLELGVNVLGWEEAKLRERVENTIKQIAGRNPDKPIFVISPFYLCDEDFNKECKASRWREVIEEITGKLNYGNVTYINGHDLLSDMSGISGDLIHPNIYGVQKIADGLTEMISKKLAIKGD